MTDCKKYTFHFYHLVSTSAEEELLRIFTTHIKEDTHLPVYSINKYHAIQVQGLQMIENDSGGASSPDDSDDPDNPDDSGGSDDPDDPDDSDDLDDPNYPSDASSSDDSGGASSSDDSGAPDIPNVNLPGISISGVVKKFIKRDFPKIGKVGELDDHPIKMEEGEALIGKTYFLYSFFHHVLLYQTNRRGTLFEQFSRYMATQRTDKEPFEPLLTNETYQMLNKTTQMRKVTMGIALPRGTGALMEGNDKADWSNLPISLLDVTEGAQITFSITADMPGNKGNFLSSKATDMVLSLIKKLGGNKNALQGKVEMVDGKRGKRYLNLFANQMSTKVDILMTDGYPNENAILNSMRNIIKNKEKKILKITGRNEK